MVWSMNPTNKKPKRNAEIVRLRNTGLSWRKIAALVGVSYTRCRYLYAKHKNDL